jgi:hypothetical protein
MPTGLEKTTVEIPFIKGQSQKLAPEVTEMDTIYRLRNVHLRKGSVPSKRYGHTPMTDDTDGAVDFTDANVKRIVSVDDELVALTTSAGSLGSGGGAGSSGDTVFAYAESADKWHAFGKIQRPTLDVIHPIATHRVNIQELDTTVHGQMMLTAEESSTDATYVTITDLASNTERLQAVVAGSANGSLVKCVTTTSSLCVVWFSAITDSYHLTKYNPTTLAATDYDFAIGTGSGAGSETADACANGDDVYLVYHDATDDVVVIKMATGAGTVTTPTTVAADTAGSLASAHMAITVGSGELAVAYVKFSDETINIRSTTDLTTHVFTGAALLVATPTATTTKGEVRVIVYSSSVRLVFWEVGYDTVSEQTFTGGDLEGSGEPAYVGWARVEGTVSTLALGWGGSIRKALNLKLWGQPFVLTARVFLPVLAIRHNPAAGFGFYKGAYITEVEPTISSAQATLMPHAACGLDVTGVTFGTNVSVVSSKAYIAMTTRRNNPFDPDQVATYFEHLQAQVCVFDFADEYRWKPAIHDHMVIFSGAYPFVYDGKGTHECGFAYRPEIMGYEKDTGGDLDVDEEYYYRVTFEYRDAVGRRWMSQPSYASEAQRIDDPETTNKTLKFAVSMLSLNMMQDAGFYFPGPLYAVLWRATAAQAAAGVYVRDTEQIFYPYETSNLVLTSDAADDDIDGAERLYIVGGELENYPGPPCRTICQHRDRLFAFNTEWNTLDYTKPLQSDRGIEWSLSQRIPCPEDIIAIESLEHVLVCFSKGRIYALEGQGPASTGVPPDAFSRLVLVNADIGCSEVNAAWRCPAGVIFRSRGGFWLVDRSLNVTYIGAPIEEDFDDLDAQNMRTLTGVVDEARNCMRIYCYGALADDYDPIYSGNLTRFNYWFDTGRWSVDTINTTSPEWACYHRGVNHIAWGSEVDSGICYEDEDVHTDNGRFYPEVIETGWIRFNDLHSFKRVWRAFISVEKVDDSNSNLAVILGNNFADGGISSQVFTPANLGSDGPKVIRIHLAEQKLRAIKVRLVETESGGDDSTSGFRFYGIGFELGMKRGGFKPANVSR